MLTLELHGYIRSETMKLFLPNAGSVGVKR